MDRRLVATLCVALLVPGCLDIFGRDAPNPGYRELGWEGDDATGEAAGSWPDLDGVRLSILDLSDVPLLEEAVDRFESLTGAEVVTEVPDDPAEALEDLEEPTGEFDVLFGLDSVELGLARAVGAVQPYEPLLSGRISQTASAGLPQGWPATPYQYRYVAPHAYYPADEVQDLFDVREMREDVLLPDPLLDPAGRAFLLATIAYFGEDPSYYNWQTYWRDLLSEPCVTFAPSHQEAFIEGLLDANGTASHGISVGYTTAPWLLVKNGTLEEEDVPNVLLTSNQTWRQVHYSAIVEGTRERAAAQAWQEFLATDAFQELVVDDEAYPAVASALPEDAFGAAPAPGTFRTAFMPVDVLGQRWPTWSTQFSELRETQACPE